MWPVNSRYPSGNTHNNKRVTTHTSPRSQIGSIQSPAVPLSPHTVPILIQVSPVMAQSGQESRAHTSHLSLDTRSLPDLFSQLPRSSAQYPGNLSTILTAVLTDTLSTYHSSFPFHKQNSPPAYNNRLMSVATLIHSSNS